MGLAIYAVCLHCAFHTFNKERGPDGQTQTELSRAQSTGISADLPAVTTIWFFAVRDVCINPGAFQDFHVSQKESGVFKDKHLMLYVYTVTL